MGGAHGLNFLVGLIRVKIVAVLLGPAGVGLIGLYSSAISLIGAVSGLGIGVSGVREVSQAYSQEDPAKAARTVRIMRRVSWGTGLLGWMLAAAFAQPISNLVFGSSEHTMAIAILGLTLLLGAVSSGQSALLQGVRRIGDLARINVVGMLINTVVAIGLYAWLRERGIVPVLLATSLVSLAVSWWFARRIKVEPVALSWSETLSGGRRLIGLGAAFMWSGLLTAGIDMLTRTIITREYGVDAAGYYQAAWALSGMFAGFILTAMGTDFYPRLTSAIHDHAQAARIVNEQTEIGVLLALPGLLGTLAFAPLVMEIFYSERFLPGAELLPWFLLGVFGRVVSWPLGYILLAKGSSRWFAATETAFSVFQLGLILWLVPGFGVVGAAYAFAIAYFAFTIGMSWVAFEVIGFKWSSDVKRLLLISAVFVLAGIGARTLIPGWQGMVAGGVIALAGTIASLRGLSARLGSDNPLARMCCRLPGGKWLIVRHGTRDERGRDA